MEKPRKISLLKNRVLVTLLRKGEIKGSRTTTTGIIFHENYVEVLTEGVVSHAGEECSVRKGDVVFYRTNNKLNVSVEGFEYDLITEEDIIAVIGERAPKKTTPTKLEK